MLSGICCEMLADVSNAMLYALYYTGIEMSCCKGILENEYSGK